MSLIKVKEYLKSYGLENEVMEFGSSSATVAEAAIAVGCKEKEIAKTLSFIVDGKPVLIVVAGDAKIDNAKYKAEFHTKAKMIPFEDVERLTGHPVGGVCPFAVNDGVSIYLDCSLKRFDHVFPACGSTNSAIKLSLQKLEGIICLEKWVDVCKIRDDSEE